MGDSAVEVRMPTIVKWESMLVEETLFVAAGNGTERGDTCQTCSGGGFQSV